MRKKIRFYKKLLIEICETLCTICLDRSMSRDDGKYRENYMSHFNRLKEFSSELRGNTDE